MVKEKTTVVEIKFNRPARQTLKDWFTRWLEGEDPRRFEVVGVRTTCRLEGPHTDEFGKPYYSVFMTPEEVKVLPIWRIFIPTIQPRVGRFYKINFPPHGFDVISGDPAVKPDKK